VASLLEQLEHCELCPKKCGADRAAGKRGFCGAGSDCIVAHYGPHFGEEPPVSGTRGSGTIFFSPCNLRCLFCQNYQISHRISGEKVSLGQLVDIFFDLERRGVHNINLVSPTPYAPHIAAAIRRAKKRGIRIPFLYNTNAYETRETLAMLRGLIDIYLPDLKYWSSALAERLSGARDYPACAMEAICEMKSQVGDLVTARDVAMRGLLVRHLVLPGGLAGTRRLVEWIGKSLGRKTAVSLMSQYYPVGRAKEYPLLDRRIRSDEYDPLVDFMREQGFENVFVQELESAGAYRPDFTKDDPFETVPISHK
jgi:putative pyruvate formate lyase activating enzyme